MKIAGCLVALILSVGILACDGKPQNEVDTENRRTVVGSDLAFMLSTNIVFSKSQAGYTFEWGTLPDSSRLSLLRVGPISQKALQQIVAKQARGFVVSMGRFKGVTKTGTENPAVVELGVFSGIVTDSYVVGADFNDGKPRTIHTQFMGLECNGERWSGILYFAYPTAADSTPTTNSSYSNNLQAAYAILRSAKTI